MNSVRHGHVVSAPTTDSSMAGRPKAKYEVDGGMGTAKSRQEVATDIFPTRLMKKVGTLVIKNATQKETRIPPAPVGIKRSIVCMAERPW